VLCCVVCVWIVGGLWADVGGWACGKRGFAGRSGTPAGSKRGGGGGGGQAVTVARPVEGVGGWIGTACGQWPVSASAMRRKARPVPDP
jgi:hypothetical protein